MGSAEEPLKRLGSALAAAQDVKREALAAPSDPSRVIRELARRDRRRRVGAVGAGLTLLLGAWLLFLLRPRELSFEVAGTGPGQVGAWIGAQAEPLPLAFSDGTSLTLAPEARARILAVERNGAKLVLEQGKLSAHVVHRDDTRWTMVAGPFEVRVTGTRFDVSWSPASDVFELQLQEGGVVVTGPTLGEGRSVGVGGALRVEVRAPGSTLSAAPNVAASSAARSAPDTAPATTVAPSEPAPPAPKPASAARAPSPRQRVLKSLRELAASGNYSEVVRMARANDFAALCREGSIEDLLLLADAARLSGASELARDALLSLRERFPREPRAATAAFLLGRIFFEQLKAPARAARWFDVYLAEQPQGELADDALSRLAEARALAGDRAGAREAARRYLERNPRGPQAERVKLLAE